ncbi:MAG: methylenetetrahydrofolate reductase [Ornithinimicrobium sp.]
MSRISVELIPRSVDSMRADVTTVAEHLTEVDTINVPDLTKFDLSSWDACAVAKQTAGDYATIPHLRAVDLSPSQGLPMLRAIAHAGIEEVLVVTGDLPDDPGDEADGVSALQAIKRLRRELPHLRVYAGLDPYRHAPWQELEYAERKLEAGAAGFFTQPFFDVALMRAWAGLLPPQVPIWWGATTVTTQASLRYWRRRNLAVFPRDFELTMRWQREFATQAVAFARGRGDNVYLMPVRVDLREYLVGVL